MLNKEDGYTTCLFGDVPVWHLPACRQEMQLKVDLSNSPVVSGIHFLSTAVALPYIELAAI